MPYVFFWKIRGKKIDRLFTRVRIPESYLQESQNGCHECPLISRDIPCLFLGPKQR